jgi:LL-diaminopimelate aminotransferase
MGRLAQLPPYLFAEIDAARRAAEQSGRDVVDLGVGDPDCPTPSPLLEAMAAAIREPAHHRYATDRGSTALRQAIAGYLLRRHGVRVDGEREVQVLIGSKEGLAHLPLALLESGDEVLVPDPGYPVYTQATILAGGVPRPFRLGPERDFLPDLVALADQVGPRTRLLYLNYPNNPTGATAPPDFLRQAVQFGEEHGLVVINDAAYLEVVLDGDQPTSLLSAASPADHRVVEFHSLSKMFNMTGWRIGFAVGHADLIRDLGRVKQSIDSGVFGAIQSVAEAALAPEGDALRTAVMAVYGPRRRRIQAALEEAGIEVFPTNATFYVWARVPGGADSLAFCRRVLEEQALVLTPGIGFGRQGEGWFRLSLTAPDARIAAAAERLRRL